MMGRALYWLLVKSVQPDPPIVAKAKHLHGEVRAAAELTNLILPEPEKEKTPWPGTTT